MSSVVLNPRQFMRGLDASVKRLDRQFAFRVRRLMDEGMRRLLRRTPVHTGKAAMSYIASVGQPGVGSGDGFEPVEATNRLPLGAEALRPRAEAISKATLATVDYSDPYKVYWIVNNADNISGLENGELPGEPFTPRSPQGMFGVTLQELITLLESKRV